MRALDAWRKLLQGMAGALVACAFASPPAVAQAVDLQLVLAVDASGSVSQERFVLQQRGYAAAFRHPRVHNAIRSLGARAIAVTMLQWTGPFLHDQVIDWTRIGDEVSALAFADAIDAAPRRLFGGGTSISGAIDYSMTLFPKSPFKSERRVIDVSGDGVNNRGRPATEARDAAVAAGVVINGLPILVLEPNLDSYYENFVIGGPGSFVVAAKSYETFASAILQKLIVEIAGTGGPKVARR